MLSNTREYLDVLERVKQDIARTRTQVAMMANAELVCMYWRIGRSIDDARDYGTNFIDTLAQDIRSEFPGIKGMNARNLRYMAKFYRETDEAILHTVCAKLSWSHNRTLMDRVPKGAIRTWYAHSSIENGWSRAVLEHQIDTCLYECRCAAVS